MPNTVTIDIEKLDAEIEQLKAELANKLAFRKWALEYQTPVYGKFLGEKSPYGPIADDLGISEYLLEYLKRGRADIQTIVNAYAVYNHSDYETVNSNVRNALSRLKDKGEVDFEYGDAGKRGGGIWFLRPKSKYE